MIARVSMLVVILGGTAQAAPDPDPMVNGNLRPPEAEVHKTGTKIDIPAVPSFDLPPPNADGSHSPKELRIKGKKLLDTEVTVKGVITWAYDCPTAIRTPGMTDKEVQKQIDDDPTVCERAKFYVGDSVTTPVEKSMWVVDVPRPYNKLELQRIKKSERTMPDRCEPGEKDPKRSICPPYKVGDEVVMIGEWTLSSPHSERNSDGLLVYRAMKNVTQRWETPAAGAPAPSVPTPSRSQPAIGAAPLPPIGKPVRAKVRQSEMDESIRALNDGLRAYGQKQWDTAIERYTKAVDRWKGNHSAWYGLSAAYAQRRNWAKAADAAGAAVALEPDFAMYRLVYGRMLYEKLLWQAKEDQARKENKKPDEVDVDASAINFEKPLGELRQAVKLNPGLWRAHYLIGAIYRNAGQPKPAATSFSTAVASGPTDAAPWIALAELYRAWDYTDQAIKVAQQGTLAVPSASEQSELWFEVGMGYDDKRLDDKAIEAFTKSLDGRKDNHKAKFARGQASFRKGDYAAARRDLEEFSKSGGGSLEFYRQQASRILMDIAVKASLKKK
jgi:tetratricopeptide (TPR) repeat protein